MRGRAETSFEEGSSRARICRSLVLTVVAALAGCRAAGPVFPPVDPPLRWPRDSEEPARLEWVGELRGEESLNRGRSFWEGFLALFVGEEPPVELRSAHGVAVDAAGRVYVSDPEARVVHVFDLRSRESRTLRNAGGGLEFHAPIGLAIAAGDLLVSDRSLGRVVRLTASGEVAAVIGEGVLKAPVGVAVGPVTGRIWVADVEAHRVYAFDAAGEVVVEIGGRGGGPGEFNFPTHLACDRDENLYVSDSLNARVQVFDREGRFRALWGRRGDFPGDLAQPKGIACDSRGRVYVVDSRFENVQVFDSGGRLLLAFGEEGTGAGEFWLPVGIAVDREDRIWVSDAYNRRVQVFRPVESAGEDPTREMP